MNEKMNAKDAGLRMEGMPEMAEWQRRAERVKIDKELLDVRMELFDISSRIEAWERRPRRSSSTRSAAISTTLPSPFGRPETACSRFSPRR